MSYRPPFYNSSLSVLMSYGKLGYRSARKLHVLHPNSDDRQEAACRRTHFV
jgi:hypothetical protein